MSGVIGIEFESALPPPDFKIDLISRVFIAFA